MDSKFNNNTYLKNKIINTIQILFVLLALNILSFLIDRKILFFIYDLKLKYNLFSLDYLVSLIFSIKLFTLISIILAIYVYFYHKKYFKYYVLNIIITEAITSVLKLLAHRVRPLDMFETFNFSFPSGHTALAFSMFFGLLPVLNKKQKIFLFFIIVLMPISRIFVLRHYLSDVLASIVVSYYVYWILKDHFKIKFK